MQEKTQVNRLYLKFSGYGVLLYIFAAYIFLQIIFITFSNLVMFDYISVSSNVFNIPWMIYYWIFPILGIIIVLLLMLKAFKINSLVHEPATSRFSIFSLLWFIFYTIYQVLMYIILITPLQNYIFNVLNLFRFFTWFRLAIWILTFFFQLNVWIPLRTLFIKRNDIFPVATSKKMLKYLILLIIASSLMLYSSVFITIVDQFIFFQLYQSYMPIYSWYMAFSVMDSIPGNILFIIGFSLLGYRLRTLKNSTNIPTPER